ncbi:hypothetical protein EIP91_000224 [Steccherinum ochraceum]|uniref:Uncharacterized protein n=1 Tax=Steccherinum ochraceum TaxID=92696 RepID=A0A4V2MWS7_9APHY|nr:hypothetical protein EIP91_000224 [Steccherinum ochraceum]
MRQKATATAKNVTTSPSWSYDLHSTTFHNDSDASENNSPCQASGQQVTLSEDAKLLEELDLTSRQDQAVFKPNPWTIAKVNASSRPPRTSSVGPKPGPRAPTGRIVDAFNIQAKTCPSKRFEEFSANCSSPPEERRSSAYQGGLKQQPSSLSDNSLNVPINAAPLHAPAAYVPTREVPPMQELSPLSPANLCTDLATTPDDSLVLTDESHTAYRPSSLAPPTIYTPSLQCSPAVCAQQPEPLIQDHSQSNFSLQNPIAHDLDAAALSTGRPERLSRMTKMPKPGYMRPYAPQSSPLRMPSSSKIFHTTLSSPVRKPSELDGRRRQTAHCAGGSATSERLRNLRAAYARYLPQQRRRVETSPEPQRLRSPSPPLLASPVQPKLLPPRKKSAFRTSCYSSPRSPASMRSQEWSTLPRKARSTMRPHRKPQTSGRFCLPLLPTGPDPDSSATSTKPKPRVITYLPPPPPTQSEEVDKTKSAARSSVPSASCSIRQQHPEPVKSVNDPDLKLAPPSQHMSSRASLSANVVSAPFDGSTAQSPNVVRQFEFDSDRARARYGQIRRIVKEVCSRLKGSPEVNLHTDESLSGTFP